MFSSQPIIPCCRKFLDSAVNRHLSNLPRVYALFRIKSNASEYSRLSFVPATTCETVSHVVAGANERRLYLQANLLQDMFLICKHSILPLIRSELIFIQHATVTVFTR